MSSRLRRVFVVAALLLATATAQAMMGVSFLPPHAAKKPAALLDKAFIASLDDALAKTNMTSIDQAISFALGETGKVLYFGLDHRTNLVFQAKEREGNCIEYAHLFATIFERTVKAQALDAHAYVVHSAKAQVFGHSIPLKGFSDHDWVLVTAGKHRFYVDPTFADAHLDWNIRPYVKGPVVVP